MPAALGPRFVLEAGFLILLAVVVGFADLSPALIVVVMAVGWLLVALIEYFAWRQGPRFGAVARASTPAEPAPPVPAIQEQVREAPPPPPPPPPPAEEETIVQPAAPEQETADQADERVAAARASFAETERAARVRHRLEPLQPRPRRRWILFGPYERPKAQAEGSREEEQ